MEHKNLYDLTIVKEFVGEDMDQILELIMIFLEDVPEMMNKLQEAYENNDFDQIKFYAHKLKSSIDLFKIKEIQEEIRSLETNARDHLNLNGIPGKINHITEILDATINCFKKDFKL